MYNNPSHISDDPSSLVNDSIIDQRSKLLLHSNEHQTSLEMNESIHLHSSNDLSMLHGPMENLKVEISLDNSHPDSQSIQQQLETMMKTKDMNLLEQLGHVHGLSQVYLQTSLQHGLACHEVHERRERFGSNTYPKKASVPLWKLFLQALKEPMLIVLMVLAVISIVLGVVFPAPGVEDEKLKEEERRLGWIEGAAILMAVFIVSSVSALNDWQKERQFRALSTAEDDQIQIKTFRSFETVPENSITSTTFQHTAHATNNNHNASSSSNNTGENFILLPAKELVVGDVIEIDQGDCIPADGLFIEGHDLKIDESSMTGETRLIPKSSEKAPFLFSGTAVGEGYGKMLVVCVGVKSVWGKTLNAMINKSDEDKKTPLEEKLDRMASWIGKFGVGFAIATFLILLLGWLIRKVIETNSGKDQWTSNDLSSIVSFMIIAVTIVVVAVPEGLPLAVTISLAYSVKKMMKDNNLVRQLAACETMGGATDICTDKTGTLTLNEMRVVKAMIAGVEFKSETLQRDEESHEQNLPLISNIPTTVCQHVLHLVSHGISVNSKACLTKPKNGTIGKDYEVSGNRTEAALLLMLREMGIDYQPLRKLYEDEVGQIVKVNTFTGARKRMSMIVKIPPSSMEQQGHDDYYSQNIHAIFDCTSKELQKLC
ncbi:hypothetical protein C9374_005959 [Naegleria lovaniensis]|uniref:Cation-transporting P-type ATPase N-terminal domain-containing protein n=1 Tax=Naegleria lovaniensis TaxID=51637 RepID=A0AA88KJI7_NAELO|nr:uncharacterized protein C9374_005959 [Naegleria lovaniensis]KAG2381575.1 hypothetical protein C9374_005959 [Naegleria lovaniensis]